MPGTFPAAAPTLSGDVLSINRFLQNPAAVQRRLRDYTDLRFVSDQILTGRLRSQGGAVLYETAEPFVTDRTVESVGAGSEYPYANITPGTASIAAIQKWGQKVLITDEEIARNTYGGAATDRAMRKVVNSIISQVDAITMSLISSAITQTIAAGTAWTAASPTILRNILLAKGVVAKLNLGYNPDMLVVNDDQYAYLLTDASLTNMWRRETEANPAACGSSSRRRWRPAPPTCWTARSSGPWPTRSTARRATRRRIRACRSRRSATRRPTPGTCRDAARRCPSCRSPGPASRSPASARERLT
jgi:hypothetical protein